MLHIGWKKKTTPLGKLGSTWVHALDVEITNTHIHTWLRIQAIMLTSDYKYNE